MEIVDAPVRHFIPPVGHLVPQPQTHGQIRAQLDLILDIPGCFERPEAKPNRIPDHDSLARPILEKCQHGRIGNVCRRSLSSPIGGLLFPLNPTAEAPRVLAFGPAHVIVLGEVLSYADTDVVAGRRRDRRRLGRDHTASDDDRAGIPRGNKHQIRGDRHRGSLDQGCKRAIEPRGHDIHEVGRENMRFLHAECLRVCFSVSGKIRVHKRLDPVPLVIGIV